MYVQVGYNFVMEKNPKSTKEAFVSLSVKIDGVLSDGKKIEPETLNITKFQKIFEKFSKLIQATLGEDKGLLDDVNFRYVKGSAVFTSDVPMVTHEAIQAEVRELNSDHPINRYLSPVSSAILDIQELSAYFGEKTNIILGTEDRDYIILNRDSKFECLENSVVETEMIVYGRLYNVGGKDPNIHIATDLDENIKIDVSETDAIKLASELYSIVGLRIQVKQDLISQKIISASFLERIPYSNELNEEDFKKDKVVGTVVWAGIDPVVWEKQMRSV